MVCQTSEGLWALGTSRYLDLQKKMLNGISSTKTAISHHFLVSFLMFGCHGHNYDPCCNNVPPAYLTKLRDGAMTPYSTNSHIFGWDGPKMPFSKIKMDQIVVYRRCNFDQFWMSGSALGPQPLASLTCLLKIASSFICASHNMLLFVLKTSIFAMANIICHNPSAPAFVSLQTRPLIPVDRNMFNGWVSSD